MNVTLINPITEGGGAEKELHLSLLYLGSYLIKNGHNVNIIDSQLENSEKALKNLIHSSDCLGFTVMTAQVKHAVKLTDLAKSIDPDIPIVWGGVHPTLFPRQTVSDPAVDYVIYGEGEQTLLELMRYFEGKKNLSEINGLVFKENGSIKVNPQREYLDLNSLSPPNWDILKVREYIHDYHMGEINYGKTLPVHSGRGCVHRCTFCINTVLEKKKWRPLSAENIVNEIRILKDKYDVEHIKFVDENFFIDKKRVKEFCGLLLKEKLDIAWHGTGRANYFKQSHLNEDLLKLAKKSGLVVISMGIESGSQKILDSMKKDITIDQVINAIETCDRLGIQPLCSFMIGIPGETKEDMIKTVSLIKKIKQISPSAGIIGPQVFRPYPGAELYNNIKNLFKEPTGLRGWTTTDILSGYTSAKYLPWVQDPEYVETIWFYIHRSQVIHDSIGKNAFEILFKNIAKFRIKHNFFSLSVDKKIFQSFQSAHHRIKLMKKQGGIS